MQGNNDPEFQKFLVKEEMKFYNGMLNTCFKDCVRSMGGTKLAPGETVCLENCFKKTMGAFQRLSEAYSFASAAKMQIK